MWAAKGEGPGGSAEPDRMPGEMGGRRNSQQEALDNQSAGIALRFQCLMALCFGGRPHLAGHRCANTAALADARANSTPGIAWAHLMSNPTIES